MGLWDAICDNVICPVGESIGKGICAVGRGVDTVVSTVVIDGVCGGLDDAIDYVKENPGKSAVIAAATVATAGVAGIATAGVAGIATTGAAGLATTGAAGLAGGVSANSLLGMAASEVSRAALIESGKLSAKRIVLYASAGFITQQVKDHVVDNYVKTKARPVKGCIVYCDLGGVAEHSGIYVGNGKIAHLDGSGNIEITTRKNFLARLGGINPALSIYVSCIDSNAVGHIEAAERAIAKAGNNREYNVIFNNCHQFTSSCITGDSENSDSFWWMVKYTSEQYYGINSWRVWG